MKHWIRLWNDSEQIEVIDADDDYIYTAYQQKIHKYDVWEGSHMYFLLTQKQIDGFRALERNEWLKKLKEYLSTSALCSTLVPDFLYDDRQDVLEKWNPLKDQFRVKRDKQWISTYDPRG